MASQHDVGIQIVLQAYRLHVHNNVYFRSHNGTNGIKSSDRKNKSQISSDSDSEEETLPLQRRAKVIAGEVIKEWKSSRRRKGVEGEFVLQNANDVLNVTIQEVREFC